MRVRVCVDSWSGYGVIGLISGVSHDWEEMCIGGCEVCWWWWCCCMFW